MIDRNDRNDWNGVFQALVDSGYELNRPLKLIKLNPQKIQAAVLYRPGTNRQPLHIHPKRVEAGLVRALQPFILLRSRRPDSKGWEAFEVSDWQGFLGAFNLPSPTESPDRALEPDDLGGAIARMAATARRTAETSNGQQVLRVVKNKDLRFAGGDKLERHLEELLEAQGGRCALTAIKLVSDEGDADEDFRCSLDRINSAGHYERGNLQVVCRFMNRWKGADSDISVRKILALLRAPESPGGGG